MATGSSYDALAVRSSADGPSPKRCLQRSTAKGAGDAKLRQAASFIKAANTSHGRRYFPAAGAQVVARPFHESEGLDHLPDGKVQHGGELIRRRSNLAPRNRAKAPASLPQQQQQEQQHHQLILGPAPVAQQQEHHNLALGPGRPSGGPAIFGKPAALQWGSELPAEDSQLTKNLFYQQMNSSSEGFFNVVLPPKGGRVPVRAWRPQPPERPPDDRSPKLRKIALSAPDLNFSPQLYGKPLLKEGFSGLSKREYLQRFNESFRPFAKERGRDALRQEPLSFNVTLRELKGMHLTASEREPVFSREFKAALLVKNSLG